MATAASITTDWTTCPICLDVFENPTSLPCIHGFCLKCLELYFKDNCPGDEVPCPMCRKEFKVPPDGLAGLQHHFFIQHLVDARNVSSQTTTELPCETCLEENNEREGAEGDIPLATVYCFDCSQKLCERCSIPHRRMKGGPHQVRHLGADLEKELIQLKGSFCDKHPDEKVKLYCHECEDNICFTCSHVKHKHHDSVEIPEVAKTFSVQVDDDDQRVWQQVLNIRERSKNKGKRRKEFLKLVERSETEIKEAGSKMHQLVDSQVAEQLKEVGMIKSEYSKKTDTVDETYKLELVARESFHAYSRELLDKGRPSDITRAASELHKRATELLANDVTSVQYSPTHVTFTPVDVTQLTNINLIGQIGAGDGQQASGFNQTSVPIDQLESQLKLKTESEQKAQQESQAKSQNEARLRSQLESHRLQLEQKSENEHRLQSELDLRRRRENELRNEVEELRVVVGRYTEQLQVPSAADIADVVIVRQGHI